MVSDAKGECSAAFGSATRLLTHKEAK